MAVLLYTDVMLEHRLRRKENFMYREKLDAYIDSKKEEMLEDLMTLVRIDSQRGEAKDGYAVWRRTGARPGSGTGADEKVWPCHEKL